MGRIITGAIFIPVGILMIGGSVPIWDSCGSCLDSSSSSHVSAGIGALSLDLVGTALVITGTILLIDGAVKEGKYNKWKASGGQVSLLERVTPLLAVNPKTGSSSVGLKLAF